MNSSFVRFSPTQSRSRTDRDILPARFSEPSILQSRIFLPKGRVRTLFSLTNLSLMNRAVAPLSTMAATRALRFRPSRTILILKCDPVGLTSEITHELMLQGFEIWSEHEALSFWGDHVATFTRRPFKNPPPSTWQSVPSRPFAAQEAGLERRCLLQQLGPPRVPRVVLPPIDLPRRDPPLLPPSRQLSDS